MLILALDTTTRSGSIAVLRDGEVLNVVSGDASKTHAERLPADIVRALSERDLNVRAVDVFAVAAGPGSFTGLRVGIAAVQGLAFPLDRPVVPVSTLDALAQIAAESAIRSPESGGNAAVRAPNGRLDPLVAAFMDAQRSEVFAALYRVKRADSVSRAFELIDGPVSEPPAAVLERWAGKAGAAGGPSAAGGRAAAGREIWVAGDGVFRYRDSLAEYLGRRFHPIDPLPPLAPTVARIAAVEAKAGRAVRPHAIRPIYVRRPDAELARDRARESP